MKKQKKNLNKKLYEELCKYKVYCKCGHPNIITKSSKTDKVLCSWCGNYVYKNKKVEFKEKLKRLTKEG